MFGISFLNSLFLWGVAAASVPIIIHLIKRNRAIKLPFAAIRFLQIEPSERFKSQRLKQILLLLMRMTAFVLLAFAFARPFFKDVETRSVWGDEPEAAVILVDNSLSMAYENNFPEAIAKAKEILSSFKAGDNVTVMQFTEDTDTVAEGVRNFSNMADRLQERFSLSLQSTNYMQALQAAEVALLESPFESKSIYLISDFQKSAWKNLNPHWSIQSGINLNFIPIENIEFSNIAVSDVHVSRKNESARRGDVLVRIKNYGGEKKKGNVVLSINNKKISQRKIALPSSEEEIVHFMNVRFPQGNAYGYVDIASDESIASDNRHFFVLEKRARAQVLAVNGEPNRDAAKDELFFLDRAINLPNLAKYSLIKTTPTKVNKYDFSNYRAVILANVKDLDRSALQRLSYYVRAGGGLILALGDNVKPTLFNRLFRDLTPGSLNHLAFKSVNRENGTIIAEVDYQHSMFRLFADPGQSDPSAALFYQYFTAEPLNEEFVLAYFDDGSPAILERKVGAGKVILFTSTLDAEWNNLPVKAFFLPLIYQTLDYVASEKKGQKSLLVGDSVPLRSAQMSPKKQDCSIKYPSGKKVEQAEDIFDDTAEPGIYEIQKSRKTSYFAVNVDPRESDLTSVSQGDLQNMAAEVMGLDDRPVALVSARLDSQQEKRQKLWRFAILAVVLLLVGETWLANRTYR